MTIAQALTAPTTAPARSQTQAVFDANVDARLAWDATHNTEITTWQAEANALAASMNAVAAGGAMSIPYTFSTTTTDADPGAGILRLDNATQASATTIRADLAGSDATDYTGVLDTFNDSSSTITGQIRIVKATDITKWLMFNVTAVASPAGYRNITVANVDSSGADPFTDADALILFFTRTGDVGSAGSGGLSAPLSTVTAAASATVDVETTFDSTYDVYTIVAHGITVDTTSNTINCLLKIGGTYQTASYFWAKLKISSNYATPAGAVSAVDTDIELAGAAGQLGNEAKVSCSIVMNIYNPTDATEMVQIDWRATHISSAGLSYRQGYESGSARYGGAAGALTGVRFFAAVGGNIDTGDFRLYGFAKT